MHLTLLNLKRKINIEGRHAYDSPILEFLSQIEIKLNWLPTTPFLVYMHGTWLAFGKPSVRKQYNVLVFLINFAKKRGSADRNIRGLLL